MEAIRSTVDNLANSTQSGVNPNIQNETSALMQNVTNQCTNGLKSVSDRLVSINDTLSQKTKSLETELHDHQIRLDKLSESFANVSSHVTSIESEWPKFKQTNQNIDAAIGQISNDITDLKSNVTNLKEITHSLQTINKQHTDSTNPSNVR